MHSENPWSYEHLVKQIYERLLHSDRDVIVYQRKKYEGKRSRQQYEIDVSFEFTKAGVRFLVLVECKFYSKNVEVGDATEFAYKLDDIGAHKGILVTTEGFQRGVFNIALASGIALVVVRPPDTFDIVIGSRGPKFEFDCSFEEYRDNDLQRRPIPVLGIVESKGSQFFNELHMAWNNDATWASWRTFLNALFDSAELDKQAVMLIKLARKERNNKEYVKAVAFAESALAIRESCLGGEHIGVAEVLNFLTGLYEKAHRYAEGEATGVRALSIRRKILEAGQPDIAICLNNLATIYLAQGKDSDAENYFRDALAMIKPSSEQLLVASIECNLANVCGKTGRASEAKALYKKSLAALQKLLGPEHPTVKDALEKYTSFMDGLNKKAMSEAAIHDREAAFWKSEAMPENKIADAKNLARSLRLIDKVKNLGQRFFKPDGS